jgi:hypothetical protein
MRRLSFEMFLRDGRRVAYRRRGDEIRPEPRALARETGATPLQPVLNLE